MKDPAMAAIRIILTIDNLGSIPEHQGETVKKQNLIDSYFDDSICDDDLQVQIQHFGKDFTEHMVRAEISSWLSDLDARPQIHSINIEAID